MLIVGAPLAIKIPVCKYKQTLHDTIIMDPRNTKKSVMNKVYTTRTKGEGRNLKIDTFKNWF